ncbi:hypothetical protein PGB28_04020 [Primorskyibacter aestuariivivens]|uniref:AAA family ATPase n=1 Tax=Primorskyibacter aestuariivivens TaxID=1888912 RepID=UPI0023008EC9|nr:hypothetical protein [Primorskyibacter aestuariivivens]MDA7427613.1 hypothetical protein [Primorskyibacter aestuariivivens]
MVTVPAARILLVTTQEARASDIEDILDTSQRLILLPVEPGEAVDELNRVGADIVIVNAEDLGESEIAMLSELREQVPDVPVIVASQQLSPKQTRNLFNLNIQDWLCKPLEANDLMEAIATAVKASKATHNRVHAVISTVGGVGASTVALSMADLAATKLFRKKNVSVALFDLDFSTGNCSYLLNMVNDFNLGSVASAPRRIDAEFLRVIQQQHEHGFYIYSFKRPELNTELNGYELVLRMLDAVSVEHDITILDIPYYETEWKKDILSEVNSCTLVTELNLPALRHTLELVELLREMRGEKFNVSVVFNKWQSSLFGQRIGKRKIKELLGDVPTYQLPNDMGLLGESMDRGVPPSEISSSAGFLKRLTKYMSSIGLDSLQEAR